MTIDTTLNTFTIPDIPDFTLPFGTKLTGGIGGTTRQITTNAALPFTAQRPFAVYENSDTTEVQRDCTFSLETAGILLTLSDGAFLGVDVRIYNSVNGVSSVAYSGMTKELQEGQELHLKWYAGAWRDMSIGTTLELWQTFTVATQADFDTWVNGVIGGGYDFDRVLVLQGEYTSTKTLNLSTTGTRQIKGVGMPRLVFNDVENGVMYDTLPTGNDYFINRVSVSCNNSYGDGYSFLNCSNLENCNGTGTSNERDGYGFSNCSNLENCNGTGSSFGYGYGYGYGFLNCSNLENCNGTGTSNGRDGYGFSNCRGVRYCKKGGDSTTETFNPATCSANQGSYSATYKVDNTANGGFNDLT